MHISHAHPWRLCATIIVLLALSLTLSGSPPRAESSGDRAPLCREDGVCLPPPQLAYKAPVEPARGEAESAPREEPCDAPLLVKRMPRVTPPAFRRLLQGRGHAQVEGLLTPGWWRVCLPDEAARAAEMAALGALPEVAVAAPDGIAQAAWEPNDPYLSVQWGLPMVGAPAAWETTTGDPSVMIAVIDSGVDYFHPDLPTDLWLGWDFVDGNQFPYDEYGHGTHVTGIAVALTGNATGVAGLCPDCSALVVRVLDASGNGFWSSVADGISYAVDAAGPLADHLVINLSLGGPATPADQGIVAEAIAYAETHGAVVVAAAGNYGPAAPMFPASLPDVISVSATDGYDRPTTTPTSIFSTQYGDLGAPGGFVFSTVPTWKKDPPYDYMSGTSMATPHVAAVAGLVWSRFPYYTSDQVIQRLLTTVDVPAGWNPLYGAGRLNVARAVGPPLAFSHWIYVPTVLR